MNALIYSSSFDGHRQVYVFVLANVLNELGFNIFIAGNTSDQIIDSSYIDKIKNEKRIILIDTSIYAQGGIGITLKEFIEIQDKFNIDLTIFAEADHHISLFTSQIQVRKIKLRGKTIGIFLRPFYFYTNLNLINKLRYIKRLKANWRYDDRLFHEFSLNHFKLLDKACYLDENFVSLHKYSQWLPDVFQQYAETLFTDRNFYEQRVWIEKLNSFKEKNKNRFIFLYFGTAQARRGYDILLKMTVEQDACFVHCGLNNNNEKYSYDINELRMHLKKESRLLETNQYISDPVCIEHFFKAISHLVLPYRNFFGSSGVMLQALEYRIPVLVSDEGIIGYRVKKYHLGLTFDNKQYSLEEQFKRFIKTPKEFYFESIEKYMQYQSISQLKQVLVSVFSNSNLTIKLP